MRTIREILADREIFHISADMTVKDAVDYLCERRIGAVAVKEGPDVVGVFGEHDVMHRVVRPGLDPSSARVRDVMSTDCIRVPPDEDYRVAKMHMYDRNVRYLVVMDEYEQLLGLLSMRHLLRIDVEEYAELVSKLNDRYYQNALDRIRGGPAT